MEVHAVFRGGKWIEYTPRTTMTSDPRITNILRQKAASVYVTALQKGIQEERAHTLAEAMIFKDLYEKIQFEKSIENDLQKLKGRAGKA